MYSENKNNTNSMGNILSQQRFVGARIGEIIKVKCKKKGCPSDFPETPNWTNEDKRGNYRYCLYKVSFGNEETYWIPSMTFNSGSTNSHSPFCKGEQVLVIAVQGDVMQYVIIGAVPCNDYRPPITFDQPTIDGRAWSNEIYQHEFSDKTYIEYRSSNDVDVPDNPRFILAFLKNFVNNTIIFYAKKTLRTLKASFRKIILLSDEEIVLHSKKIKIVADNVSIIASHNIDINGLKIKIEGMDVDLNSATSTHGHS